VPDSVPPCQPAQSPRHCPGEGVAAPPLHTAEKTRGWGAHIRWTESEESESRSDERARVFEAWMLPIKS